MKPNLDGAIWRKSSRSGSEGNCVEVATNLPDLVAVRDTKDRDGGTLMFSPREWAAFIAGVRGGEFDL
ncbi:DUF397 domain-containing protein [Actinoplanes sp. NBRC 103695]|uniref:DUF397 domain-containing protein n=1 Tax=Actinoplanes sp. NBRC 103695 TaxID=3032202 RepID=UPI0024A20048|nr:DUF397 domain-containing protein [Actinoplanes sp. NBRC 103695]GLY96786.1 hypothetical protein Acsp02_40400 [Actinoplanes sp. NBRC 103695]